MGLDSLSQHLQVKVVVGVLDKKFQKTATMQTQKNAFLFRFNQLNISGPLLAACFEQSFGRMRL